MAVIGANAAARQNKRLAGPGAEGPSEAPAQVQGAMPVRSCATAGAPAAQGSGLALLPGLPLTAPPLSGPAPGPPSSARAPAPPTGSRLPPDGDEFPPRYHDPLMLPSHAPHAGLAPTRRLSLEEKTSGWRKDERSERSVRDKIAMFSTAAETVRETSSPVCHQPLGLGSARRLSNKFKSSEDVFQAPGLADQVHQPHQPPPPSRSSKPAAAPALDSSSLSSTLPRKERASVLARATSFSGNFVRPPAAAATSVHGMTEEARRASLSALVEQRRKSISKLRGLVIPDKVPEAPSSILDLPEIRSRDALMIASSAEVLYNDSRPREPPAATPETKSLLTSALTSPPWKSQASNLPKYSPAFKRKSLTVRSASTASSVSTSSSLSSSREELRALVPIKTQSRPSAITKPPSPTRSDSSLEFQDSGSPDFRLTPSPSKAAPRPRHRHQDAFITDAPKSAFLSDSGRSAGEESDNDSAVSSSRSSISHGFSPPASPLLPSTAGQTLSGRSLHSGSTLRRTLSSETTASVASSTASTITSGSQASSSSSSNATAGNGLNGSSNGLNGASNGLNGASNGLNGASNLDSNGRRVLKAQSVDAINRKNVLFSARYRSGRSKNGDLVGMADQGDPGDAADEEGGESPPRAPRPVRDPREEIKELERMVNNLDTDAESNDDSVNSSDDTLEPRRVHYRPATLRDLPAADVKVAFLNGIELDLHPVTPTSTTNKTCEESKNEPQPPPIFPKPLSRKSSVEGRLLGGDTTDGVSDLNSILAATEANTENSRLRSLKKRNSSDPLLLERNGTSSRSGSGLQAVSVNDIRKAFEKAELALSPTTPTSPMGKAAFNGILNGGGERLNGSTSSGSSTTGSGTLITTHVRGSSIDSTTSEDGFPGHLSREQFGSITSLASTTSLISQQELQQLIDDANQTLEEANNNGLSSNGSSHEVLVVILHRETAGASVGITLAGGADYETKEITVHKVLSGSPAERDGRLQKGDRILSINGRNMKGVTHRESLAILKAPRPEVVLVVSRSRGDPTRPEEPAPTTTRLSNRPPRILEQPACDRSDGAIPRGPPVNVMLQKDGAGLGFSLEGGKDSPLGDRPLTIKKIFTGGCAEKSGRLQAGDELLSVNNSDVTQMSRIEAWGLMKRLANGKVTLTVRHACVNATPAAAES